MARKKQVNPVQRMPSGDVMLHPAEIPERHPNRGDDYARVVADKSVNGAPPPSQSTSSSSLSHPGLLQLVVCVSGIYVSFLSWALLQERITKTPFKSSPSILNLRPAPEYFTYSIVLNTIQSAFASLTGSIYLFSTTSVARSNSSSIRLIFPTNKIFLPLLLVSITSSLASPFGYASLAYVDYLTFILAKSCKLLPVMFLHLTIFRKRYPLYKYLVVFSVTLGVAIFTLYHPSSTPRKQSTSAWSSSSLYGLSLLGINLLFDGLTNTIQDHIFTSPSRYGSFSGPQMMVSQNLICTLLTTIYLLVLPHIPSSILPLSTSSESQSELSSAIAFLSRHPEALYDVLGFAACGAVGQVFIFMTLNSFGSLLLVTVTVTRKMLSMLLSVVWFGKTLGRGQWLGVGLVFGGVGLEGVIQRREKLAKGRRMEEEKKKSS